MASRSILTPDIGPGLCPVAPGMSTMRADAILDPTRIRTFVTCSEEIPPREATSEVSKEDRHLWCDLTTCPGPGCAAPGAASFGADAAWYDAVAKHPSLRS